MGESQPNYLRRHEVDEEAAAKIQRRWQKFQEHLGYTDEELAVYRADPKRAKTVEDSPNLVKYNAVIEVIEAKNCGAGYKVGDKFLVDPEGCLILEECPPRICISAVWAFKPLVSRMWQAFYDGNTEIFQDTVRCPDVGVHRGGWGEITMRISAVPRKK